MSFIALMEEKTGKKNVELCILSNGRGRKAHQDKLFKFYKKLQDTVK